jgi:hypothetical protein
MGLPWAVCSVQQHDWHLTTGHQPHQWCSCNNQNHLYTFPKSLRDIITATEKPLSSSVLEQHRMVPRLTAFMQRWGSSAYLCVSSSHRFECMQSLICTWLSVLKEELWFGSFKGIHFDLLVASCTNIKPEPMFVRWAMSPRSTDLVSDACWF